MINALDFLRSKTSDENKKIKDAIKFELKTLDKILDKRTKVLKKNY